MSIFDSVGFVKPPKTNPFNLSRQNLMTAQFGKIYPVFWDEIIPGDKFRLSPAALIKLLPLYSPIMQNINVTFDCFVVPYRLLCKDWKNFIYDANGSKKLMPFLTLSQLLTHSEQGFLLDYLGIPPGFTGTNLSSDEQNFPLNIWPILAYNLIYQNEYRDEDLIPFTAASDFSDVSEVIEYDDSINGDFSSYPWWESFLELRNRSFRKDYFTSCRPWPQKGVAPSLGFESEVNFKLNSSAVAQTLGALGLRSSVGSDALDTYVLPLNPQGGSNSAVDGDTGFALGPIDVTTNPISGLTANDFRTLFTLQQWLEKNAVAGSRYIEGTLSYFGVRVKDARAQEPEFIGRSVMPVQISEVLQTSESNATPQGFRSGVGNAAGYSKPFKYFATEHSVVMVLMSIMPAASYFQGIRRAWTRTDIFDYPWPEFQRLGEQAVRNMELYVDDQPSDRPSLLDTFGYQSRYAELRSSFNEIHGEFRSTLLNWHCGRQFGNMPLLNQEFIECDAENDGINRIFNYVKATDKFYCQLFFDYRIKRPFQYHSQPAVI